MLSGCAGYWRLHGGLTAQELKKHRLEYYNLPTPNGDGHRASLLLPLPFTTRTLLI